MFKALSVNKLFLLIAAFSAICGSVQSQETDTDSIKNYLQSSIFELDLVDNNDYSSFSFLDASIDTVDLFITGEWHGMPGNEELKLKLFKYLYYKAGVRTLLVERGYAECLFANKFLQTGDEKFLRSMDAYVGNERYFYNELFKFYQLLPQDDKFTVVGVDFEADPYYTAEGINVLLSEVDTLPDQIKELYDDILFNLNWGSLVLENSLNNFLQDYKQDSMLYSFVLDTKFTELRKILTAYENYLLLKNTNYNKKYTTDFDIREKAMYENVKELYLNSGKKKMFGQFGARHIPLKSYENWLKLQNFDNLGARLNGDNSPLKGKIIAFYISYYGKTDNGLSKEGNKTLKSLVDLGTVHVIDMREIQQVYNSLATNHFQFLIRNRYSGRDPEQYFNHEIEEYDSLLLKVRDDSILAAKIHSEMALTAVEQDCDTLVDFANEHFNQARSYCPKCTLNLSPRVRFYKKNSNDFFGEDSRLLESLGYSNDRYGIGYSGQYTYGKYSTLSMGLNIFVWFKNRYEGGIDDSRTKQTDLYPGYLSIFAINQTFFIPKKLAATTIDLLSVNYLFNLHLLQFGSTTNSGDNTIFYKPEIGFGWNIVSLSYGRNFIIEQGQYLINRHEISLRLIIPLKTFPIF